MKKDEIKQGKL